MILIPLVSTERATTKFVFTNFNTDNGLGITSYAYIFVLGLLMSQYTITGYDASAHMVSKTWRHYWLCVCFFLFYGCQAFLDDENL